MVTFDVSLTGKAETELHSMKAEVKLFKEGRNLKKNKNTYTTKQVSILN